MTPSQLSKRLSELEKRQDAPIEEISVCWEDNVVFARFVMQGDICLSCEDMEGIE